MPLFTNTSIRPNCSSAASRAERTAWRSSRSITSANPCTPCCSIWATVVSRPPGIACASACAVPSTAVRAATATSNPAAARSTAAAFPMPRLGPVTRGTGRGGAPFPFVTVNTVGPTLMSMGTEEQKQRFLPGILQGELNFAIGYTEPEAGTDLASLRTRAVRDGDQYVVNGNKVFTSGANLADFIWLACRTDADAPKHKGISILIVPTGVPGFSCTPIETVGELSTTATFYDDVR